MINIEKCYINVCLSNLLVTLPAKLNINISSEKYKRQNLIFMKKFNKQKLI